MPDPAAPVILLSANSAWNVLNFRAGLIRGLDEAGFSVAVAAPGDQPLDALKVQQHEVVIDRSGLNPLRDLALMRRYRILLERHRPAAYLSFTIKPNIYGCAAARLTGVPAFPNVSGLGTAFIAGGWLTRLVTRMYRFAFARCPAVFFQNPTDRDLFIERKIVRRDQARLLPGSGIDLDGFQPRDRGAGPEPRVLFVGRLLGDKGVREFVEAARALRDSHGGARFQLLGGLDPGNRTGVSAGELQDWVDEGVIEYLGEADDVRAFLADADLVVLPSYREGLPRVLLEAGAMARPVVATNVPGCRDVVVEGETGLLCEARSGEALATAIGAMLAMTPAERAEMGARGRARVQAEFSEARVVAAYLDALGHLRPRRS